MEIPLWDLVKTPCFFLYHTFHSNELVRSVWIAHIIANSVERIPAAGMTYEHDTSELTLGPVNGVSNTIICLFEPISYLDCVQPNFPPYFCTDKIPENTFLDFKFRFVIKLCQQIYLLRGKCNVIYFFLKSL